MYKLLDFRLSIAQRPNTDKVYGGGCTYKYFCVALLTKRTLKIDVQYNKQQLLDSFVIKLYCLQDWDTNGRCALTTTDNSIYIRTCTCLRGTQVQTDSSSH